MFLLIFLRWSHKPYKYKSVVSKTQRINMRALLVFAAILVPALSARLPFIVGGRDATPGKWPWQASLQRYNSHNCGASLISSRWLVTAAHCVGSSASAYSVILGAHDLKTQRQGAPKRYSASRIVIHPGWRNSGSQSFPNDIALIYTSATVDTSSKYVSTISLPSKNQDFAGNSNCWITGWGRLRGGGSSPNNLQELKIDVWSSSQCSRQVNRYGSWHVCVRKSGGSACNGDSGGPLACNSGGQWKLVGAASFVYGSCSTSYPSVYANVPYFRDWIKSTSGV